jgi:hypothetical protein
MKQWLSAIEVRRKWKDFNNFMQPEIRCQQEEMVAVPEEVESQREIVVR